MASNSAAENELNNVRSEIFSANTQSSIVLAAVALASGPAVTNARALLAQPWPVVALLAVSGAAIAGAVWSLLDVVLPRLDASGHGSFLEWARRDRDSLAEALAEDYQLDELLVLSRIAAAKYRCLRRAGLLLKVAFVALILGVICASVF